MKQTMMKWMAGGLLMMAGAAGAVNPGEAAPAFQATCTKGQTCQLSDMKGKYVVLEWTNPGCPFVQKHYKSGNMQKIQKQATEKGAVWITVNSASAGKLGGENAERWNTRAAAEGSAATARVLDTDGKIGRAFGAKTTPHVFVVNPEGVVIYQGAFDDQSGTDPAENAKAKNYVLAALEEAMAGKAVTAASTPPYGCGVKY